MAEDPWADYPDSGGWVVVLSPCVGCGHPFSYNPHLVPSVTIAGTRHPICQACVTRVNPLRRANGLPEIVPLAGAYEPLSESAL